MADKYIINMPEKTAPLDTDLTMVEDGQDTKRMTWANFIKPIKDMIGNLASLTTNHKSTLVGATNEVLDKIGNLSSLTTTHKSTVVGSNNELWDKIEAVEANNSLLPIKIYNTGTTVPNNAIRSAWDSLPINNPQNPVTFLVIRVAGSGLGLAAVAKESTGGRALLLRTSGSEATMVQMNYDGSDWT